MEKSNTINLTEEATKAINALQHPYGTYYYYRATLDRIFSYILHCSDEIGMSDTEAISTLRALDGIRSDLASIAGPTAQQQHAAETKELMKTIEEMFPCAQSEAETTDTDDNNTIDTGQG